MWAHTFQVLGVREMWDNSPSYGQNLSKWVYTASRDINYVNGWPLVTLGMSQYQIKVSVGPDETRISEFLPRGRAHGLILR